MTKIIVKKISFSTYIKFVALFGASLGLLMTIIFLIILPTIFLSDATFEGSPIIPFFFMPILTTMAFTIWGTMSYPLFLLIRKIFKKITLEVEISPIEEQSQPEETPTNQNSEF